MKRRVRAAGLHFLASSLIAVISSVLVFLVWYPQPYAAIAGGLVLFGMLMGIDVILGPCLTALVAGDKKPLPELKRDIAVIVLVQLVAFGYGMYTIASARPVHMVFEVDRLTVVTAADLAPMDLSQAPANLQRLSWTGPTLIATRKSATQEEFSRALDFGLQGVDISMQPDRWIDYAQATAAVLSAARPIAQVLGKYPQLASDIRSMADREKLPQTSLKFLPLTSKQASWIAVLSASDARIIGYLPVDGFF